MAHTSRKISSSNNNGSNLDVDNVADINAF